MRQILFALMFLPTVLMAQTNQGEIFYKEISRFEIEDSWRQYVPKDMPDSMVNETVLIFNDNQSLYKNYENLDDESEPSRWQEMMSYWMGSDNQIYRNLEENVFVEKKGFQGKTFTITGEIQDTMKWKIMPSTDKILGYSTMLATAMADSSEVKVWFTTEIPKPFGPMSMGGLPGLVLQMEMNADKFGMRVVASKIDTRKIKDKEFKRPKGGQAVTRDEYNDIMKQKMEEMRKMREQRGGRGN